MMVRLLAARNQPLYHSLIDFRLAPKALLKSAWSIAPGIQSRHDTSAESAIQLTGRFKLLPKVNRAFSAGAFGFP